jgi:hypothetical protein
VSVEGAAARKAKFRAELLRWLWSDWSDRLTDDEIDSPEYEEFEEGIKAWACEFVGSHEPTRDQCNLPEHDFCGWCSKSMPNSWKKEPTP